MYDCYTVFSISLHKNEFVVSSKTWLDIWPINLEEMSFEGVEREYISEAKYAKLEAVVSLCKKYGVYMYFYFIFG